MMELGETDAEVNSPENIAKRIEAVQPPPISPIDLDWLRDSAKSIKWTEKTLASWISSKFKVTGGLLEDVVAELTKEQAGEVTKQMQDRLDMK